MKELDVLLVDNASADGTDKCIQNLYSKEHSVIYENAGNNLMGARGFSHGIKLAVIHKYEYLWIMEDDTILLFNVLEELKKKMI